jgi:hypothetical protein
MTLSMVRGPSMHEAAGATVMLCHYSPPQQYSVLLCLFAAVLLQCYAGRNETAAYRYGSSANCLTVCPNPTENPVGT